MALDYAFYSEKSNVGFNMKVNEDYILFDEHSFGDNLFAVLLMVQAPKKTISVRRQ